MRREEKEYKKERKKEKDPRDTLKLRWRHHLYLKKNLDKTNPTTTNKVTNGERCEPHEPSKGVKAHLPLSRSWGPLQSPLITFLGIVGFILLRSFQRYRWCRYQSFDVSLGFFFPFSLSPLSPLFIESCIQQFCNLRVVDDTWESQMPFATL